MWKKMQVTAAASLDSEKKSIYFFFNPTRTVDPYPVLQQEID